MKKKLAKQSTNQLLEEYTRAAILQRTASRDGDYRKANATYRVLDAIVHELRAREATEQARFLELLNEDRIEVRGWSAVHALIFAPEKAIPVLEQIASGPESLEEFSARMVLDQWRKGEFKLP